MHAIAAGSILSHSLPAQCYLILAYPSLPLLYLVRWWGLSVDTERCHLIPFLNLRTVVCPNPVTHWVEGGFQGARVQKQLFITGTKQGSFSNQVQSLAGCSQSFIFISKQYTTNKKKLNTPPHSSALSLFHSSFNIAVLSPAHVAVVSKTILQ